MFPGIASSGVLDCSMTDAELSAELPKGITCCSTPANFDDLTGVQLGSVHRLAFPIAWTAVAALPNHIPNVVLLRPDAQVPRICAFPIIAGVHDIQTTRDRPVM